MKILLRYLILLTLLIDELKAQDYFLMENTQDCTVQGYKNGKLETVPPENFYNVPLKATQLKMNPAYLGFTIENQVYISPKRCLKLRVRTADRSTVVVVDKYYLELEVGVNQISDQGQVPADYNNLFPSTSTTTPTTWGVAPNSTYGTKSFFQVGFGIAATPESYFAVKFRMFKGSKTDSVILTDVNSGLFQTGVWNFSDLFLNAYFGYKVAFIPYRAWKITLGGYVGASKYSSNLSDGINAFELKSFLLPVFLFEIGPEYRLEEHVAVGINLGYEYLGRRSLTAPNGTNVKTKMSYTNTSETFFIKYYF